MTNLGTIILLSVCTLMGYVLEPMFFSGKDMPKDMTPKKPAEKADNSSSDTPAIVAQSVAPPIESKKNVDKTNFKELAAPRMLGRLQNTVANNDTEPVAPETPPVTPVTPEDPTPTPIAEVDPPAPPAKLDQAAIVALLKADVGAGKVTQFKTNQVTKWSAGEEMKFDGGNYQTGRVTFKAETILGVQENEAIALIKGGKIYKWMWARTKLEMR